MLVKFNELKKNCGNVILKDFNYLSKEQSLSQFKGTRRNYRNILIEGLLEDTFIVNNQLRNIYTVKGTYKYSCSYTGYNIAVAISHNNIGIDIEMYKNINIKNLDIFTNDCELNLVKGIIKKPTSIEAATFIWCLKESIGKLFNVGLSKGFKSISICKKQEMHLITNFERDEIPNLYVYYKLFEDFCLVISSYNEL
ncbi:4-phosphopantetheinyl transferase family protein [Alkaliphilus pronyensis]|uniref:4-phosphopantetheinyl transferase family protein n=1 Tax=Alkaliphilus pronyensis TaxID=1482732 RepID=A0A6I0F6T0_9FIRM|nr:4'-phosphopantetheinyl transferase superfamily protein [Alkaliphilus pronyensis]KAB3533469.1 4-phosphopantetheinyl transferase family protein [Alkaliphilus pronyensis]